MKSPEHRLELTSCAPSSYWKEERDAGKFSSSVVFDPTYGFGGSGSGPNSCITNGPFANYTNSAGPGYQVTSHCIDRRISEAMSALSSQSQVDACLKLADFSTAWPCIEGNPHSGGHAGVGGQVSIDSPENEIDSG